MDGMAFQDVSGLEYLMGRESTTVQRGETDIHRTFNILVASFHPSVYSACCQSTRVLVILAIKPYSYTSSKPGLLEICHP